jgi:hypothetical protein
MLIRRTFLSISLFIVTILVGHAASAEAPGAGVMPDDTFSLPQRDQFTLACGGPYIIHKPGHEKHLIAVRLQPGESTRKLSLLIQNSYWDWFRISVGRKVVATEKSLKHETKASGWEGSINLSGVLKPGPNRVLIEGAGRAGTSLSWDINMYAGTSLSSVDPNAAAPGDIVTLKGKTFSTALANNRVYFNDVPGTVISAMPRWVKVQVPSGVQGGHASVYVKVRNQPTNELEMVIPR